jgi:hypothetical protein
VPENYVLQSRRDRVDVHILKKGHFGVAGHFQFNQATPTELAQVSGHFVFVQLERHGIRAGDDKIGGDYTAAAKMPQAIAEYGTCLCGQSWSVGHGSFQFERRANP